MSKIIYSFLALLFLLLCIYLLSVKSLELPSRYGASPSIMVPPITYFMAALPLSFSISLLLYVIDAIKYKKYCGSIVAIGVILFFIGVVIVSPLLKSL